VKVWTWEAGMVLGSVVGGFGSVSTPKKHKRHFALLS